jgi:hypothetical protein
VKRVRIVGMVERRAGSVGMVRRVEILVVMSVGIVRMIGGM